MRLWITKPCAVLPDYLGNNCKKTFSHTQYKHNFFQIFCSLADELLVGKINCISLTPLFYIKFRILCTSSFGT